MAEISGPPDPAADRGKPRLLAQVHDAIRRRYYSRRTEEAYVHWIRQFIRFSGLRHSAELGELEVTALLNHLVLERKVAAARALHVFPRHRDLAHDRVGGVMAPRSLRIAAL
jgi:hypothetical protein